MNKYESNILSNIKNISYNFGSKSSKIINEPIFTVKQTHGDNVFILNNPAEPIDKIEADSIITNLKGIRIGVKTADCVPILITDLDATFISAIHSGWRGSYYEITPKTIDKIIENFKIDPNDIVACVGPSILSCCYEVSFDLWNKFKIKFGQNKFVFSEKNNRFYLNLARLNLSFLQSKGISKVDIINQCTFCNDDFFSYRRDKSLTANQISNIRLN
jgi:hypothetical protein|tara:strand:- start:1071 stop:1721 length:651 start_codon:yes stop_codon:yes gene_type:complete